MQLRWGSYQFDENSCSLRSNTRIVTAPETGRPLRYLTRCSIEGWLEGDTQAECSLEEALLRTALLRPYQDLRFLTDSGATTSVSLLNSQSISGVRVLDFSFPGDTGAEFATVRRFTAEVEAEFLIPGTENVIVSFTESLSFSGNGKADEILRTPINDAEIVKQVISRRTPCYATQQGQAVGHTKYPLVGKPKWPDLEMNKRRQTSAGNPKRIGRGFIEYPISWTYYFQSPVPLTGIPSVPPL